VEDPVDTTKRFDRVGAFSSSGWQRAARCGPDGGNCVEVNLTVAGLVAIRDSKLSCSPILIFPTQKWRCFLTTARTDAPVTTTANHQ
jgi:hypothetical protein